MSENRKYASNRAAVSALRMNMIELILASAGCLLLFPIAGMADRMWSSFSLKALAGRVLFCKQALTVNLSKGDVHAHDRKITVLQE